MKFTLALPVLFALACLPAGASEIPPGTEAASAPAAEDLDRVEAAELARSDPDQKGGDAAGAVVAVAVIAAIVVLVWLALDRLDHKS